MEDYYELFGLKRGYRVPELRENIFFLHTSLEARFRHPRNAMATIRTEEEYHKYRNLMFMQTNLLIMRMYLRLGSQYDKRHLYFHDLDVADDLEVSFSIARTYYYHARQYWEKARHYAEVASQYPFTIDLHTIESERHLIMTGERDFARIIDRHLGRVEAKLEVVGAFLDEEGRPRPVKETMLADALEMFEDFASYPLDLPRLRASLDERSLLEDLPPFPEPSMSMVDAVIEGPLPQGRAPRFARPGGTVEAGELNPIRPPEGPMRPIEAGDQEVGDDFDTAETENTAEQPLFSEDEL